MPCFSSPAVFLTAFLLAATASAKWTEVCNSNATHCASIVCIACVSKNSCYTSTASGVYRFDPEHQQSGAVTRIHHKKAEFLAVGGTSLAPEGVAIIGSEVFYFTGPDALAKAHVRLEDTPMDLRVSPDGQTVLIGARNSSVFYSQNGGKTFNEAVIPLADIHQLTAVSVVNANVWFIAAGSVFGTNAAVLKTLDGGNSFQRLNPAGAENVLFYPNSLACQGEQTCVMVGRGIPHNRRR